MTWFSISIEQRYNNASRIRKLIQQRFVIPQHQCVESADEAPRSTLKRAPETPFFLHPHSARTHSGTHHWHRSRIIATLSLSHSLCLSLSLVCLCINRCSDSSIRKTIRGWLLSPFIRTLGRHSRIIREARIHAEFRCIEVSRARSRIELSPVGGCGYEEEREWECGEKRSPLAG